MAVSEKIERLTHPESNNQKRKNSSDNEKQTKWCLSTDELSLSSRSSCARLYETGAADAHFYPSQTSNPPLALLRNISIETNEPQGTLHAYPFEAMRPYRHFRGDFKNYQSFYAT